MAFIRATTRRSNGRPPVLVGRSPYDYAEELWDWLDRALDMEKGLPAGFNGLVPPAIIVGGSGSAGTAGAGWQAADAIPPLPDAIPEPLLLGVAELMGATNAVPHADFLQDTIGLLAQVRNHISMRI